MAKDNNNSLSETDVDNLIERQSIEWPLLKNNLETLRNSRRETMESENTPWKVSKRLLNYRKGSLTANLDAIAKGERPCFLCRNARPAEQEYILWGDYEILVNPYPAGESHFTIVNREHVPQSIESRIVDMVELAERLRNKCVFYNGARCGASAPDHMHFQAISIDVVRNFRADRRNLTAILDTECGFVAIPNEKMAPFGYFVIEVNDNDGADELFGRIIDCLSDHNDVEPMINVLAFNHSGKIRIVIIPRRKHRPSIYGTDEGAMLVSPASLEMAGMFLISREADFDRLNRDIINEIYTEVGYSHEEIKELTSRITR